jgi:UDP-GlcNAc:undecaprenyl-phosphate GlcNAc-1-phosphate transferase
MESILLAAGVAFAVALGAGRLAMALAVRLGFLDRPGTEAHKQQARAVPYGGGFAVALALVAAIAAPGGAPRHLWAILAGAAVLLAIGAWDDRRAMKATVKLAFQGVVAAAVVWGGDLAIDSMKWAPGLGHVAAWVWLVAVSNAYNLIDHADGLSGTVGAISALVLVIGSLIAGDVQAAAVWAALAGGLAGFLVWNAPPARLYLGDAGSMPLGLLIGGGALTVTYWPQDQGAGSPFALLAPLLVAAIPLFDAFVVAVKRIRRGRPIMQGDRNHISHRLRRLGLGPMASLCAVGALQMSLAAGALQLRTADTGAAMTTLAQAFGVLLAVLLLETTRDDGV